MFNLIIIGIAILWFGLALTAAAPGIVGGDSGELTSAAFHLGSAHAPGYPLYVTLGHLFQFLPLGTPAFRMTFFSILAQWAAFLILIQTLKKLMGGRFSENEKNTLSLLTAGVVMAGSIVSRQLISPEVFSFHLLFAALLLRLVLFPSRSNFLTASLLLGLSLSHQHLTLLIVPAIGWAYRNEFKNIKKTAAALSFFIVGLSPYLVLILRAVQKPLVNWGNPANFQQFIYHLTRSQYGGDFTSGSIENGFWDLFLYSKDFLLESWGLGLLLAVIGLWKNRGKLPLEYFIGVVCLFAILPILIRGDYDPENNHINESFLPPALLWFAPLFLKGMEWIYEIKKNLQPLLLSAAILFISLLAGFSYIQNNSSRNLAVEDIGSDILLQMPSYSVLFSSGDSITFPLAYLKLVRCLRPDLYVFDRTGGLFPDLYHLLSQEPQPVAGPSLVIMAEKNFEAEQHPSAVYYSEKADAPREPLAMSGLLFREISAGGPVPPEKLIWDKFKKPTIELNHDYLSRETAARYYLFNTSYNLETANNTFQGEESLKEGKRLGFDNSRLMINAGVLETGHGWTDYAAVSFERATELTPRNFLPWFNRGIIAENQKRSGDALKYFKKSIKLNPDYPDAHQHLGFQYFQLGLFDRAIQEWETVIKLDPKYAEAYRALGYMYMQSKPEAAAPMLNHYLLLTPNAPDRTTLTSWLSSQARP